MILDEIVAQKKNEVAHLLARAPLEQLQAEAEAAPGPRDFVAALRAGGSTIKLIAEIKRKSPSKGVFCADLDAPALARTYAAAGASCISVLTDRRYFLGTLDDLRAVRAAVAVPVLRKEFIVHPAQVFEARAAGADAILLIAAILDDARLQSLSEGAQSLGMAALIEVHDEPELRRAQRLHPALIGINNRDLRTFRTDLGACERLRPLLSAGCVVVGESGIHARADVERLEQAGVNAILVGESLVLAADLRAKVRELLGPENG